MRYSLFKSIALLVVFLFFAPVTLASSFYALANASKGTKTNDTKVLAAHTVRAELPSGVNIYASLPKNLSSVDASVTSADARAEILRQYLRSYDSPLAPFADLIVQKADEYNIDFRLITAIAQQESNLCKFIPDSTYNCWGWGIHSEGTLGFSSYSEGIDEVSKGLSQEYIGKGLTTPLEIMSKYTPLSNGSWARGVSTFMDDMR